MDRLSPQDRAFSEFLDSVEKPFARFNDDKEGLGVALRNMLAKDRLRLTDRLTIGTGLGVDLGAIDRTSFEAEAEKVLLLQRAEQLLARLTVRNIDITPEQRQTIADWIVNGAQAHWAHNARGIPGANQHQVGDALTGAEAATVVGYFCQSLKDTFASPAFRQEHMGTAISS